MADYDEERTESAREIRRVADPESMESEHDEEEKRSREEHERHRTEHEKHGGESQNRSIQINDHSDETMTATFELLISKKNSFC